MRISAFFVLVLTASQVFAQIADLDPDWKEQDVAPPAVFRTDRLIPIEMPRYVSVKVGIDPETLTISSDGIVRYVVVASSPSGNQNAAFEGIWCRTGDVKIYARYGSDGKWNVVRNAEWKPLSGNQPSMHALAMARQGVCNGRSAAASSTQEIIRMLKLSSHAGVQN